jgi:uncharacterized membrane protein
MDRMLTHPGQPLMTQTSAPTRTAQPNIETVVRLEEEEERRRSFTDRFPEMIGSFAGSVAFVVSQLAFVGLWAVANLEVIPGLPVFDRPIFAALRSSIP